MKFPPSSLDDLIVFSLHEKLTDLIKSWHLHSRTMSQNFKEIGSGDFEILSFLFLNDPTDKIGFELVMGSINENWYRYSIDTQISFRKSPSQASHP